MFGRFRLAVYLVLGFVLLGCGESPEEVAFRKELVEKALNDDTRKMGDAFMKDNAAADGVVALPSGLQYKVLESGDGERPKTIKDIVSVHYQGQRVDGVEFDSSYGRGKPVEFPLDRVIRGWTEAVMKMRVGDVWMLYIPPELAYGATSPAPLIPANSTLIFKVELLSVKHAEVN